MQVTRLSHTRQLLLNILWFPMNAETAALLTIVIPTQILLFVPSSQVGSAEQATLLGWMIVVASSVSLLLPPFIGAFSDRTRGKLGRRRPYLLAGGLLLVASTPLLVNASTLVAFFAGLALGGGVISGVLSGVLSDRMRRRAPVVCVATLFMAATSFAFVVASGNLGFWLWPLGVLFGLGYGAFSSVDWALTMDALPSLKEAGKHLGLWNASTTLPAMIAPLLGSFIISVAGGQGQLALGYRLVFACATVFLLIAAIGILFVREHR
jgi:MFS family permease